MLEKNKQINFKKRSLIIIFLVFVFFVVFYFTPKSPIQDNLALPVENNIPVRIKIPSINIDAPIESVGLTIDGEIDVPEGPINAAWFDQWPRPGEDGNSIIIGHSGWKDDIPAVFDNLYKLQKGDKIYIEDSKGMIISFVVNESRKYDPKADALDVFYSNDGKSHLNLITCIGVWNKISKSRSDRLVVFTDKE